jgi:8-oxo-dGTP pyrophosphatase MutT (NUDIX family)
MTSSDLHIIQSIFDHPLPGRAAHAVLAKNLGRESIVTREDALVAAVMILLLPNTSGELEIVLTQRAVTNNADIHSGQMSFPGGKYDDTDMDFEFTALRETWEEIGVSADLTQVLGKMTPLYIPVSNFIVHPYVGYVDHQPDFVMEEREVAEIVTSPLSFLLDYTEPSSIDIVIREGMTIKDVPYFNVKEKVVWGATSMMLNEFLWAIRQRLSD